MKITKAQKDDLLWFVLLSLGKVPEV